MSLQKFLQGNLQEDFGPSFRERWAGFLLAHFATAAEVAVAFGVREQTAINWIEGLNRPTGDRVALAYAMLPEEAARHLSSRGGRCRSSSDGRSGR